jgi:hypothetical protein
MAIALPDELFGLVLDALLSGTTFAELVANTAGFGVKDREDALRWWVRRQPVGERLASFDGSDRELEMIIEHIEGKRMWRHEVDASG